MPVSAKAEATGSAGVGGRGRRGFNATISVFEVIFSSSSIISLILEILFFLFFFHESRAVTYIDSMASALSDSCVTTLAISEAEGGGAWVLGRTGVGMGISG
jgi:hypothetical protein